MKVKFKKNILGLLFCYLNHLFSSALFLILLQPLSLNANAQTGPLSKDTPQVQSSKLVALIKNCKGTVLLSHGNSVSREVKVGEKLFENSILETKEKSTVLISFCENYTCQLRIGSNSKIKIDELMKIDSLNKNEKSAFNILTGIVSFIVKKKVKPLDIKLKSNGITFGIRGTQFVIYSYEDKKTLLAVKEGKVEVENELSDKGAHVITENMTYLAKADGSVKISTNDSFVNSLNWDIENLNISEPEIGDFDSSNPSVKVKKNGFENQVKEVINVSTGAENKAAAKRNSFSEEKIKIEEDINCLVRNRVNCNLFSESILLNLGINPKTEAPELIADKLRLYLLQKNSEMIEEKKKNR
jgi:hypothetical protein